MHGSAVEDWDDIDDIDDDDDEEGMPTEQPGRISGSAARMAPSMGTLLLQSAHDVMKWAQISGWMFKLGKKRTIFKRRWCVLVKHEGGHMSMVYYSSNTERWGLPRGLIPLVNGAFTIGEPPVKRHSRRKYPWAFQLSVTLARGRKVMRAHQM